MSLSCQNMSLLVFYMSVEISRFCIVDKETGEEFPYKPKGKHKNKYTYFIGFLRMDCVFDFIIYYMTSNNISKVERREILTKLNISKREYTREIDRLIKNDDLIRISNNMFFVNPKWKLKTSRTAFNKINGFYLNTKIEMQKKEIEDMREPKQYAKRVNRHYEDPSESIATELKFIKST